MDPDPWLFSPQVLRLLVHYMFTVSNIFTNCQLSPVCLLVAGDDDDDEADGSPDPQ